MSESDDELADIRERKREELQTGTERGGSQSPGEPVHVNGEAELDATVTEHDLVLVDFYADWCGPCEMMEPALEGLAAERDVTVAKVDVDANQPLAGQYGVRGIPMLVLFEDGEPVRELTGLQQRDALDRLIDQHA